MNWNTLEEKIYYKDGSLRDIYIKNININDWILWIKFVNEKYKLEWYNGITKKVESKIDSNIIFDYLNIKHDLCSSANIFINNIQINSHFFDNSEFENDIDPIEFKSIEDHNILIEYLKGISKLLNKEVIVSPENYSETVLIRVKEDFVEIDLENEPIKKLIIRKGYIARLKDTLNRLFH